MPNEDSLRQIAHSPAPFSAWLGTLVLFGLFGVIVLAVIGPSSRGDSYEKTRAKKRAENLKTLRDEEAKNLAGYAWVDQTKGTARIPIDRAMKLIATELSQKKPAAAGPIASPSPAAAAAASPAAAGSPPGAATPAPTVAPAPQTGTTPKAISVEGPQSENRGQPAAAANPPAARPATQPGAAATAAASPSGSAKPETAVSPAKPTPAPSPTPARSPESSGSTR